MQYSAVCGHILIKLMVNSAPPNEYYFALVAAATKKILQMGTKPNFSKSINISLSYSVVGQNNVHPLKHGGGAVRPLPFFLPVTQNYYEAPIPENS